MAGDLDAAAGTVGELAKDLQEQSRQALAEAEALACQVARLELRGLEALELWREWFERFGQPWFEQDGELWCVFCDGADRRHKRGCIFVKANRLLEVE